MKIKIMFKVFPSLFMAGMLFGQTSPYRILYPPHATMTGVSTGAPALGGADGSNNLFPVVTGNGFSVDMGKGALSFVIPVGAVPGEIPIPVVFRYNASNAWPVVSSRGYISLSGATTAVKTGISPMIGTGGMYAPGFVRYARPIFGTIDFGFISSNDTQSVPGTGDYGKLDQFTPNPYYVLEDGTVHSSNDFTTMTGTFSLPPQFGLAAKAASAVTIDSSGTLVAYPAVAADLGSWASKVASVAPVGFTAGTHSGYYVVMDRDRARVYAYAKELYAWVPLLWVDRFGHWVSFQWRNITTGLPSGIAAVRTVQALNQLGKGVQLQWAEPTAGGGGVKGDYLRADFINVQAPSIQVTAYPDLQTTTDAMLPLAGGPVLRPTRLRIGNPSMPLPDLGWAQLPVPQQVSNPWPWPASDLNWYFSYNVESPSGASELTGFQDPLELQTGITWQDTSLVDPAAAQSSTIMVDNYRSVQQTTATNSGVTLTRTFTWNLPTTATATAWTNTYNEAWSGTQTWNSQPVVTADNPTTTYQFAIPSSPDYGNGSASKIIVAGANATSTTQYSYSLDGVDGTLTGMSTANTTTTGAPPRRFSATLDIKTGSPTSTTTGSGPGIPYAYESDISYTYERHPEYLDPNRCTTTTESRLNKTNGVYLNPKQMSYAYDSTTFLLSQYCLGTPSAGIGTNYTYFPKGDNRYGHLQTKASFASGTSFSTSGGKTETFYLDPTTALPSRNTTTYDGPTTVGCTNSVSDTSFAYDSENRVTSYMDSLGVTVGTSYDARGRFTRSTRTGDAPINTTYPSEIETITQKNGRTTTVYSDSFGRPYEKVRGSDGVVETYSYDQNGQLVQVKEVSPAGNARTTSKSFDALGRLIQVTPPVGPQVTYTYSDDGAGNQVQTAKYTGQIFTTTKSLDLWWNPASATDPYGTITNWQYDAQGHVTKLTVTPSGQTPQVRSFNYSTLGLLLNKTEPETGTTTYNYGGSLYNIQGLPLSIRENDGRTRTLTYDGLRRVRSEIDGTDNAYFNYNGLFLLSSSTNSANQASSISYTPDTIGRVHSETITPEGSSAPWAIIYGYDSNVNRLTSITYPQGRQIVYHYDDQNNFGRITSVTNNGLLLTNVSYDTEGWGHLGGLQFASNASDAWNFTPDGTQINSETIAAPGAATIVRNYGYDALNHLNRAGEWTSLAHDWLGRLTLATSQGMGISESLQHDGFGNNTNAQAGAALGFTNFTFAAPLSINGVPTNQIPPQTQDGFATQWSYDGDGEAKQAGTAVGSASAYGFAWDGLGRLSSTTLNGSTETYAYLPSGIRFQVLDSGTIANNRRFAYSSGGLMLSEYTGSGTSWAWKGDVVYLGSLAIAEIDVNGVHELHCDHLGTPILVTSPGVSGFQGAQMFGTYGESLTSPYPNAGAYVPMTGYTGHLQTDADGLIYMRGRFYSPQWHRFLNSDQGADAHSLNQYAYVGESPAMGVDPSGMKRFMPGEYPPPRWATLEDFGNLGFNQDAQFYYQHFSSGEQEGGNQWTIPGMYILDVQWVFGGTWQDSLDGPVQSGPLTTGPGAGYGYSITFAPEPPAQTTYSNFNWGRESGAGAGGGPGGFDSGGGHLSPGEIYAKSIADTVPPPSFSVQDIFDSVAGTTGGYLMDGKLGDAAAGAVLGYLYQSIGRVLQYGFVYDNALNDYNARAGYPVIAHGH